MNLLMRAIFSLLLLFTLSIPVISDCVAMVNLKVASNI